MDEQNNQFKIIHLQCGKLNRNNKQYELVNFIPTSPYSAEAYIIKLKIDETNNILGKWDSLPIQDGNIVEFTYNTINKQWIPLRTRYDKTGTFGNDYFTANSIWKNMHLPITNEMITTGKNILKREEYYFQHDVLDVREQSDMINLRKFHNAIKKHKLQEVVKMIRKNDKKKILSIRNRMW